MQNELDQLLEQALEEIKSVAKLDDLDAIRVRYLGKKGRLTQLLKGLGKMSPDERKEMGQIINQCKTQLQQALMAKKSELESAVWAAKLKDEVIDVTLPGLGKLRGAKHPVTLVKERMVKIFSSMGFSIEYGPEIETEKNNFDQLNIPETHPARAMHDTFFIQDVEKLVLRTHTSPVQIRVMEQGKPPFKMISLGRVYRCDSDQTHTPMFHQIEGLLIDDKTNFSELVGLLQAVLGKFFSKEVEIRLRPSYFPFTEPSAEVDMQCVRCSGKGCRLCGQTGWLEILGCGMVHSQVLKNVGIDDEQDDKCWRGFAFGMGLDRLAMLYYGMDDLRTLFKNELDVLEQFR